MEENQKSSLCLTNDLIELRVLCERAKEVCADLVGEYFGFIDPDLAKIKNNYAHFSVFADIIFEYICKMNEIIISVQEGECGNVSD